MDSALFELVCARVAASPPPPRAAPLVLAACRGDEALRDALSGTERHDEPELSAPPDAKASPAWLARLTVQGFRGIGPKVSLDLDPGPGLVLITGRNGAGKSSLSEALETALRGTFRRWEGGTADSRAAWQNLHGEAPRIEVELLRAGERIDVVRAWAQGSPFDAGASTPSPFGQGDLDVRNPFLAYSDLGTLFSDRPSDLYDVLWKILGLEALTDTLERVRTQHTGRTKAHKDAVAVAARLRERLATSTDPRAERVRAALDEPWDLDAVEAALTEPAYVSDPDARRDEAIRDWTPPTGLVEACASLRALAARRADLQRDLAGRAQRLARLLRDALEWPDATCPVCETPGALDDHWKAEAQARLSAAEREAEALQAVEAEIEATRDIVRAGLARPSGVSEADLADLGDAAPWIAWTRGRALDDVGALADHVDATAPAFLAWLDQARRAAAARLAAAESGWRPFRNDVAAWHDRARQVLADLGPVADLKAAEKWLVAAQDGIRAERFAPIADEARAIWRTLRQESSVELRSVALGSLRKRRKVDVDVDVDGEEAPAVGVMSQGELMSLALSLFIPRLASDDSPFGFVVIDDPVQSMDPHKVDGLALVLADLATRRQVVVLTHDTRLRDSLFRLAIGHRAWRVERGRRSVVEIRELEPPTEQPLRDADRVLADGAALGDRVVRGVVPGFCRESIEVALAAVVRRRRLKRGEAHADVEDAIRGARGSRSLAALALFDNARTRHDVEAELTRLAGAVAASAYAATIHGAEARPDVDLKQLIRNTRDLARALLEVPT